MVALGGADGSPLIRPQLPSKPIAEWNIAPEPVSYWLSPRVRTRSGWAARMISLVAWSSTLVSLVWGLISPLDMTTTAPVCRPRWASR